MTVAEVIPEWSIRRLVPGLVVALDARPWDSTARLVAADAMQDEGYEAEALRYRWIAEAGKRPFYYGGSDWPFGFWITAHEEEDKAYWQIPIKKFYQFASDTGCDDRYHRYGTLRQQCEDDLIAFLLRFTVSPFAESPAGVPDLTAVGQ